MNIPEPLKTKLLVPPLRRDLVARSRLLARLDESLSGRLALVSAPAGYGKTTLLSSWARGIDLPVAWLSLDEGDNDPARFLGHFCASFEAIAPSLAGSLLELVRADRFGGMGAASSIEAVETGLLNRLQTVPHSIVLVLDDFHLISAQPIHRLVASLVEKLPPQIHMVIASRADPPLPLARLRARGQMVEIRQGDLRFTPEETTSLLNQVLGLGLEAGDASALASRTEGWVAGLRLAAVSVQAREDVHRFIQEFKGSNRFILDYLVEEVLQEQTIEVREFLLQTSLLDRLTGSLCDAVTEQSGGQIMLERLERSNLFIVPLDDERRWYRYHRLFSDLLRKQLEEAHPDLAPNLHRRAGKWYEDSGLPAEAIDHALAAGEPGWAAQMIERVAEATLMRSEATTLLRWLDALPEAEIRSRPSLSLYYAWVLLLRGESIDLVEGRISHGEEHLTYLVLPLRAFISLYRGDLDSAIEQSRRALKRLPEEETFLRGLAALSLAGAYHAGGDTAGSQRVLQDAALGSSHTGNVMNAVYAAYYQAERCRRQGDLRQAWSLFRQALEMATERGGHRLPIASQVLAGLGEIAREWNDLDGATRYLLEGIALAGGWTQAGALESYIALARVRQAQGDWAGVHDALQAMRQVAMGFKASDLANRVLEMSEASMQIAKVGLSSGSGHDLEAPRHWADQLGLSGDVDLWTLEKDDDVNLRRMRKYEYSVAARLRIAEGRFASALALLESALPNAEKANRIGLVIEYQILVALAAQALSQEERAMRAVERALALAEPGGFVRVFVDEGEPMARLLKTAASRQLHPEYVERLLAAFQSEHRPLAASHQRSAISYQPAATDRHGTESQDPGRSTQNSALTTRHPLVVPLSERELDVLRLVAEGLSNEEVARRLVVSLPTIKFHTSNIYGKLGVRNRTEAVARARDAGILPLT